MSAYAGVTAERWRARPGLARACRVVAFAGPVVAGTVLAFLATRWLPSVSGLVPMIGRWVFIAVVAVICAVLAERLLSRLLPIAALLDLDIGFPAGAPTRLRIASLASLRSRDAALADRLPGSADHDLDAAAEYTLVGYATRVRPGLQPRPHLERVRMLAMLVAVRLGLSVDECDRLQWALLLRELGSVRPDERSPDHPLVAWLGPWSALLHGPFVTVARDAPSARLATAAHAAAVSDAYAVVTASHPYRRGVGSGHAGHRLKTLADPGLLPEAADALLTLPEARLRKAIGFTAGVSPLVERFAPAPQPVMAATSIVVVLALAASPLMRSGAPADDRGAELAGLDSGAETAPAPQSVDPEPAAPAAEVAADRDDEDGKDERDARNRNEGSAMMAGSQYDYMSASGYDRSPSRASGSSGSSGSDDGASTPAKQPSDGPTKGSGGGGSTPPPPDDDPPPPPDDDPPPPPDDDPPPPDDDPPPPPDDDPPPPDEDPPDDDGEEDGLLPRLIGGLLH